MFLRIDAGLTLDCRLTSFTIRRNDPVTPPRRRPHLAIKTREAQSYPPPETERFSNPSRAVNCQATLDQFLRDEDIRALG